MKALPNPTRPVVTPSSSNEAQGSTWKQDVAVAATTVLATAAGVYGGVEIGAHFLADHIVTATQGHGIFALLTGPIEAVRGMYTHILPWAAGTGSVSGLVGYAAGRAAFTGAPLTDESSKVD